MDGLENCQEEVSINIEENQRNVFKIFKRFFNYYLINFPEF